MRVVAVLVVVALVAWKETVTVKLVRPVNLVQIVRLVPFAELVHASATCIDSALLALLALEYARISTPSIMSTT